MSQLIQGMQVRLKGQLGKMESDNAVRFVGTTTDGEVGTYRGKHPGKLGKQGWHLVDVADGTVVPCHMSHFEAIT